MQACLLVDEVDKVVLGAAALVVFRGGAALGEELDGRVGLDALVLGCLLCVGGFGVDFGDDDGGFLGGEGRGEGFPGWGEGFAV